MSVNHPFFKASLLIVNDVQTNFRLIFWGSMPSGPRIFEHAFDTPIAAFIFRELKHCSCTYDGEKGLHCVYTLYSLA